MSDSQTTDNPLALFTIAELFDEVTRRTRVAVLVIEQEPKKPGEQRDTIHYYDGGFNAVLGMLTRTQHSMLHGMFEPRPKAEEEQP